MRSLPVTPAAAAHTCIHLMSKSVILGRLICVRLRAHARRCKRRALTVAPVRRVLDNYGAQPNQCERPVLEDAIATRITGS